MNSPLAIAMLALTSVTTFVFAEEPVADFSDRMTSKCEVQGLLAHPPAGWLNVPMESSEAEVAGCQMMLTREGDDALVGILRILSVDLAGVDTGDAPWWSIPLTMEIDLVGGMGYVLGEVLWTRDSVPVHGEDFGDGRAIGFESGIEGNDTPQEAHFLLFERADTKYIVTLLTPAREVEEGVYYRRNTTDLGSLISSFTVPAN